MVVVEICKNRKLESSRGVCIYSKIIYQ